MGRDLAINFCYLNGFICEELPILPHKEILITEKTVVLIHSSCMEFVSLSGLE